LPTPITPATLHWQDKTPWSDRYGDIYHSQDDGPGHAQHVFIAGNGLPERWQHRDRFAILETGFGTGLNFLATWAAWQKDPHACQRLHYLAAERHPFSLKDLAIIHARWPQFAALAAELHTQWPLPLPGFHRLSLDGGRVILTLLLGDALHTLPQLTASIDAFYLDGFAPDKNPDLWSEPLFTQLARLAAPTATLATGCVTDPVRRGLQTIGLKVEKVPGFGRKHEILRGGFPGQSHPQTAPGHALIVGAGVAGCAAAASLCQRGWQVTLLEQRAAPAQAASGNHAGIVRPVLSRDDNLASRFTRAAFLHAARAWPLMHPAPRFDACGVLHLAKDETDAAHQQTVIDALGFPAGFARWVGIAEASHIAGRPLAAGGWYFPGAGWAQPASLCHANLAACGARLALRCTTRLEQLQRHSDGWHALDASGHSLAQADIVILTGGADMIGMSSLAHLPLRRLRGQVSLLPEASLAGLRCVVCRDGYVIPPVDGIVCTGASYDSETDTTPSLVIHQNNLQKLEDALPGSHTNLDHIAGRIGFRAVAPDRMPLIGPLAEPGLYALLGLASRGLVWSQLAGELLASQICAEPLPLEHALLRRVAAARY